MNYFLATASLVLLANCSWGQSETQREIMRKAMAGGSVPAGTWASQGRTAVIPTRTPLSFFATYEDMVANKPAEGIALEARGWFSMLLGKESVLVNRGGQQEKVAVADLKYWGFASDEGVVMRIFDGTVYNCLALGAKCVYLKRLWYNVSPDLDMSSDANGHTDCVSEGPNAEITSTKHQVESWVEVAAMTKEYEAAKPKREMKDSVMGYFAKLMKRDVDFVGRINSDSAVK